MLRSRSSACLAQIRSFWNGRITRGVSAYRQKPAECLRVMEGHTNTGRCILRSFAFDQFDTPGSVQEVPQPEPEAGQVRVRVAAAGINPADVGVIKGFYKDMMEHHFPLIPGLDFAGTVDAVGEGVEQWKVGDEVFGGLGKMAWGNGTLAEYATASTESIARRPEGVDREFAAALNLAGVSALTCIDLIAPQPGDVVVILGAAGGIGGFFSPTGECGWRARNRRQSCLELRLHRRFRCGRGGGLHRRGCIRRRTCGPPGRNRRASFTPRAIRTARTPG